MKKTNMYNNGIPQFDEHKYALWIRRIKTYVHAQEFNVWKLVVDGYKEPATPPTDNDGNKLNQNNLRDKNVILNGLVVSVYVKVMHCDSAKENWDKL
jgi:hypothetical protein